MGYIITGRVHPERADISFSRIEMGVFNNGRVMASCDSSQITLFLDAPNIDGWHTAKVIAEDIAGIIIGSLGFSLGSGYWVEMIQVTEENGIPHVFGVRPYNPNSYGENLSFTPHIEVFNRALKLASKDVFFRLAVRDYLQAINDVQDCATYCYRSVESIKGAFSLKSGFDRWDEMHAALGTNRAIITATIKDYADPIRHGNWTSAKPTDIFIRWKMLELTKSILNKYLDIEQPTL